MTASCATLAQNHTPTAPQCGAKTRAGTPCRTPGMKNGRCRLHGGKSTGPKTPEGRARCSAARLIHGKYTKAAIAGRKAVYQLELNTRAIIAEMRRRTTKQRLRPTRSWGPSQPFENNPYFHPQNPNFSPSNSSPYQSRPPKIPKTSKSPHKNRATTPNLSRPGEFLHGAMTEIRETIADIRFFARIAVRTLKILYASDPGKGPRL